ncbi:hypothetical protein D9757_000487 [Collybiopsis confluens]|uniref:Uncharacterized protein n=1 Tax=Collybiopsis confluens TaxID=2823264 RepID=A0A8H5I1F8_9AGAR|nr:hypothetical protein D9757_000487 [Collybiopsis confluens]
MFSVISLALLTLCATALAQSSTSSAAGSSQTIVVTVSNATSSNASSVFSPSQITANVGDLVLFNFTAGNHTATQSAFFAPCTPINYTNGTNGFDSNFAVVPANWNISQGAFPIQAVPILESNKNDTMWFYDVNTCAQGGVGVINLVVGDPATAGQTLDGFRPFDWRGMSSYGLSFAFTRNAVRLNGTHASSSASHSSTSSSPSSTTSSSQGNAAQKMVSTLNTGFALAAGLFGAMLASGL